MGGASGWHASVTIMGLVTAQGGNLDTTGARHKDVDRLGRWPTVKGQ